MNQLAKKLENRKATAAVIGLGYVGLPLAMEIGAAGFDVIGIDLDCHKINAPKQGKSYILDVPDETLEAAIQSRKFTPTCDFSALALSATEEIRNICTLGSLSSWKVPPILGPRMN